MKKNCINCQKEIVGRSDKSYCSVACKNEKNNALRKQTKNATQEIDGYLHRNREILALIIGDANKVTIDKLVFTRAGFRFEFCTGIFINKENKTYFIVYDYAWMSFSNQSILVVRKTK